MGPDSVVGKVELFRQLINRARRAAQNRNDLPASAIEKAFIQLHCLRF
jgi:hypothetical protein